jgi:hypothetical protein
MRQSAISIWLAAALVGALALGAVGCGSSSSPATITITPSPLSMTNGQITQLTVTVLDSSGKTISSPPTITYTSSNPALISVNSTGLVCAGVWNANGIDCNLTNQASGSTATITVTSGKASQTDTVFTHANVDSVVIASGKDYSNLVNCISQNANILPDQFTATACSVTANPPSGSACPKGQQDITSQVGPFTWTVSPSAVATPDTGAACSNTCATGGACNSPSQCVIWGAQPGQAAITAKVANTVSSPALFSTCPVQSVTVQDSNGNTAASLGVGAGVALNIGATDKNGVALSGLSLTFSSSQPVSVTAGTTVTGAAPGTSAVVVSCTPPSCNPNLYPVYGNAPYITNVTGTTSTAVYVASTSGNSVVPIATTGNSVGTAVTIPNVPNSMLFNPQGTQLVLGSDSGAMIINLTASKLTITTPALTGKALAISPDGNTVIFAATAGNAVFFYNIPNSTITTYGFPAATDAAFSPDGFRAYVVSPSAVGTWSSGGTLQTSNVSAASVDFLTQGSFAYLAGGAIGNVTAYATCNSTPVIGVATPGKPVLIRKVPTGMTMVAADSPNIDLITASTNGATTISNCVPALSNTVSSVAFPTSFTANQLLVSPDGSKALILASDNPAVLAYTIAGGTTSTVPLVNSPTLYTGGITLDGAFLYVGASDNGGTVHVIDLNAMQDVAQISISFTPNLVAVRPH